LVCASALLLDPAAVLLLLAAAGPGADIYQSGATIGVGLTQEEKMATLTDLEIAICDLPRWARIVKTLQDAKFGPGMDMPDEPDEALRLVINELYEKAVRVRTMYYQSLKQARGGAEPQPTKAAAE
jgi:hypothetical protein